MIDRLRALRMDTTPLRTSRDFRLLFLAGTVFYFGAMVSYVAVPYQIYTLTGSNFAVGAIGLVELAPILVFGLYGGALADHVDRRKLLISTGLGQAVFTAILAVNAFRDEPDVWVIFVVAVALASATGASLRLVSLVTVDLPASVDTGVIRLAGAAHAEKVLDDVLAAIPEGVRADIVTAKGDSIEDAVAHLDWLPGEMILVGSSRLAQPRRLFLGSVAAKLLSEIPVPMFVVPRTRTPEQSR